MNEIGIIIAILAIWNIIVFAIYGIDKKKSKTNKWRISEQTLIILAFLMGGVGAFIGMQLFRHKTKHSKFKILVPLAVILNIAVVFGVYLYI